MRYLAKREDDVRLAAFEREMRSIIGREESYEVWLHEIEHTILRACKTTATSPTVTSDRPWNS